MRDTEAVLPVFVELQPETPADSEKLTFALRLLADDALFRARADEECGAVVVSALSDAHLEYAIDRLREFAVQARVSPVRVAYLREFRHGAAESGGTRVLLEPVMRVAINVPREHLGVVLGILNVRRAYVQSVSEADDGGTRHVLAFMSAVDMLGFAGELQHHTQRRATHTVSFDGYQPSRRGRDDMDDRDRDAFVGEPRRPSPAPHVLRVSLPEPDL